MIKWGKVREVDKLVFSTRVINLLSSTRPKAAPSADVHVSLTPDLTDELLRKSSLLDLS